MIKNAKTKEKLAHIYARFSPRRNADECESCESQVADLTAWCAKRGIKVGSIHQDKALSGGDDWDDRPGMFDAAQAAKRGHIFVVRAFDRLFRDTRKALIFHAMLEAKGVEIISTTEEVACGDDPGAQLMRTMLLAWAEYQRQMIRARTRAKMRQYQKQGRRMGHQDKCPWGTQANPDNPALLENVADECAAISTMRELHEAGHSLRGIAVQLNERGVPHRKAKEWTHIQVGRILRREGVL